MSNAKNMVRQRLKSEDYYSHKMQGIVSLSHSYQHLQTLKIGPLVIGSFGMKSAGFHGGIWRISPSTRLNAKYPVYFCI